MKTTLLCTVGTSLFDGNLKKLSSDQENLPHNWEKLKEFYDKKDWDNLVKELLKIKPNERIVGAEINTIEMLKKKSSFSGISNLILFISDTELGRDTGSVLKNYFQKSREIRFNNVRVVTIKALQDEDPIAFKNKGLRNLVREMGKYISLYRPENIVIDATGGYKAQIAIAVIIGQALDIPVFYKHERFSETIAFPPLPVSLDYDILGKNSDILIDFENNKIYSLSELKSIDEKLRVFLNEVQVDNEKLFELNPIGQLYLTTFRIKYPKKIYLVELPDSQRKKTTFPKHHLPLGFKEFVRKVWFENKYIKRVTIIDYNNQKSIKRIGFFVKNINGTKKLIGTYEDRDNFKGRFQIEIPNANGIILDRAADDLNRKYKR